jgi:hypothetical protein
MKQILPVCCFCQKVRDDEGTESGRGLWQEFRIYMVAHKLRPEDISFSHTYCHDCMAKETCMVALGLRSTRASSSLHDNS